MNSSCSREQEVRRRRGSSSSSNSHMQQQQEKEQRRERRSSSTSSSSMDKSSDSEKEPDDSNLTANQLLQKLMGFEDFSSSKNKDHTSSSVYGVNKKTKRKFRQYMNRKGGFNRPLSPVF